MDSKPLDWLAVVSEIQAITQSGLTYSKNEFDKERFIRLRQIAAQMAMHATNHPLQELIQIFSLEKGYATPKIDVRSFIIEKEKLLLVKERSDGLWTLPGGFADVNESPSEAVIRETREEAGYEVRAIKLLALWDKHKHDHPPQWPHVYKCFFHCEIISGQFQENLEIIEQDFFELDKLPSLSTHRVTAKQIETLYGLINGQQPTLFD